MIVMPLDRSRADQDVCLDVVERGANSRQRKNACPYGHILYWILLCLFSCIGLNDAIAQESPRITGLVLDSKTMEPVSGAVVLLTGTLHGSLTGSDGYFEFAGIHPGDYTLTVSAEGYAHTRESLEVKGDMELKVLLLPEAVDLPDQPALVSSQDGWSTRMFRGLLPLRVSAIEEQYTLYGSELTSKSFYLDGVRLMDPSMLRTLIVDIERSEVVPSPYNLGLGMDASIDFKGPEQHATGAELFYDSRTRRMRSGTTFHQSWSTAHGTLRGIYERADNYSDGSGALQQGGIRAGNIAGYAGIQIASGHALSGSGGWLQDLGLRGGDDLRRHMGVLRYRYTPEAGMLQDLVAVAALQERSDDTDPVQQSGSISATLLPMQNLRLKVGADIYRYTERTEGHPVSKGGSDADVSVESGVFVAALHRISSLLTEGQFRLEPEHGYWGGMIFLTWQFRSNWQLIAGAGRARSVRGVLRQTDIGVRWTGFARSIELMTFSRNREQERILGVTALIRGAWWWAALYTAQSRPSALESETSLVTWARVRATVQGPFELFLLGTELYGTFLDAPAWGSADVWMQVREIHGVSLKIGIMNLLDGTYTYPHSVYAEPGRSVQIALQYQRN